MSSVPQPIAALSNQMSLISISDLGKRKRDDTPTDQPPTKKKKPTFFWLAKWFPLTYSCPVAAEDNPIPNKQALYEAIHAIFPVAWIWIAEETHENGTRHYHVSVMFKRKLRSRKANMLDLYGVHPNVATAKQKPGQPPKADRMQRRDWCLYLMKEDEDIFDMPKGHAALWLELNEKKGATALARVADYLYDANKSLDDIIKCEDVRQVAFMHRPKIVQFVKDVARIKFVHFSPLAITTEGLNRAETKVAKWWNSVCVNGDRAKKQMILYLSTKLTSKQKSTLLNVVAHIMNGSQDRKWCSTDRGWQDNFHGVERVLCIDALQEPLFKFSILEDIGTNSKIKFPIRNGSTNGTFQGPALITSNKSLKKLCSTAIKDGSKPWDGKLSILKCRTSSVKPREGLKTLVDRLISTHGLDRSAFVMRETLDIFSDDDDSSEDEDDFIKFGISYL